jgi:hypothetical protein
MIGCTRISNHSIEILKFLGFYFFVFFAFFLFVFELEVLFPNEIRIQGFFPICRSGRPYVVLSSTLKKGSGAFSPQKSFPKYHTLLNNAKRFYFVDERVEDGSSPFQSLNGQAHAEEFYKLATRPDQGPWEYTFVASKGYVDFEGSIGTLPDFKGIEERVAAAEAGAEGEKK